MFDTTGIMDKKILKELGKHIVPDLQRLPLKLLSAFALIAGIVNIPLEQSKLAAMQITSAILFFLFDLCLQAFLASYIINWNLKVISEYTDPACCGLSTCLNADGVHVTNHSTGGEVTLAYIRFKKLVETKSCYFLMTKRQFAAVFKAGLSQEEKGHFIPYIKEQCPKIRIICKI